MALDFPELVIVAGHIGYPWTNEMIALAHLDGLRLDEETREFFLEGNARRVFRLD